MSTPQQPQQPNQQPQQPNQQPQQQSQQPVGSFRAQVPPTQQWPLPPGQQWQGPYGAPSTSGWWQPGGTTPPGFVPPAAPPGHAGGPAKGPRRHRAIPAIAAAALVVAAAAGGVGFGHLWWPGTQSASSNPVAMSSGSGASSKPTGSSGDGTSGSGGSGSNSTSGNGSNGNSSNGSNSNGSNGNSSNGNSGNGYGGNSGGSSGSGSSGNGNGGSSGNGYGGSGTLPPELLPGGLFPGGMLPGNGSGSGSPYGGHQSGTITSASGAPADISSILNKVDKGVVDINDTFAYQQAAGAGTGIVLTSTGEILTNNHVIDGATSISVTDIGNGKTYAATVVGYDPSHDIAVLQLKDASGLTTASIGNSNSLKVGDAVVGIGNAGGIGGTPSAAGGSVTALDRSITVGDELYGTTEHLSHLIEVNSDIQSGDSGGPLVTSSGAVVGIDTAAASGGGVRGQGSDGYAIPIDAAMSIARSIESGHSTAQIHVGATAALGVLVSTESPSQQGQLPSQNGTSPSSGSMPNGALVAGVIDGGAAASTGMQEGSVITSLGGKKISSSSQLSSLMLGYRPGQTVKLGWTDPNGQAHTSTVTLGTGPAA